ncbi:MAG TPA: amidohydrolase family protein [Candidatus Binatus sp.]|nr:amidohydrolase family protein [Candidatus Binatus sp.]
MVDLLLRGGRVCDGTGAPARDADVAIAAGRIVAIGRVGGGARRTIDVSGLIVAPGFVDVHTHYDAQITWDRLCTPSCWHGVTSVVVGNCGFSLAPCRPADRERLLRMLEHVEGMPLDSLRAGIAWEWESFPEYLAMLRARPLGLNVGALLGHSAIRVYVLGEDAYAREARAPEIRAMQQLVRDGMAAGAVGLATSRSPAHVGDGGRPVPSRQASRGELEALVRAMGESGRGVLEITTETFPITPEELGFLQDLARESRRPVSFSAILDVPDRPGVWEPVFDALRAGIARGAAVFPQLSCRPMRFDFDLETGCASLDAMPCWRRWRAAPSHAARLALLRDPEFRAAVKAETVGRTAAPASRRWAEVVLEESARPEHEAFSGRTLAEIAAARGGDAIDALLDVSAAADLRARFSMLLVNYDDEQVGALLRRPEGLIALSDAGAHVSVLCDAGYATHLLGHWVRGRGLFGWEEAVRRLTSMPAAIYGIPDRGLLAPGLVADVTCFDPTRVAARPPEKVRDFPAGGVRYVTRADGIEHVFIRGEEFLAAGEWTGASPGTVLEPAPPARPPAAARSAPAS